MTTLRSYLEDDTTTTVTTNHDNPPLPDETRPAPAASMPVPAVMNQTSPVRSAIMPRQTSFELEMARLDKFYVQPESWEAELVWDPVVGLFGPRQTPTTRLPPIQMPKGMKMGTMLVLGKPSGRMSGPPRPNKTKATISSASAQNAGSDKAGCQDPCRVSSTSDDAALSRSTTGSFVVVGGLQCHPALTATTATTFTSRQASMAGELPTSRVTSTTSSRGELLLRSSGSWTGGVGGDVVVAKPMGAWANQGGLLSVLKKKGH